MVVGQLEIQLLANMARLQSDMDKAKRSVSGAVDTMNKVLGTIGAGISIAFIGKIITDTAKLSQRYQELGIVLGAVSRNAGLSAAEVNKTAEAVRKSGISMIESRQIVSKLVVANIDLSKATELARLAQDAAVIGQINSSQALDKMVHGITSAQVEVLRGIGINVNFEQSYAKLAKQLGVTTNNLSEQQKMQARLNVVLEQSTSLAGVYESAMDNAGKQMRSTERIVEDLKVTIGGLFDETSKFAVTAYTLALKDADSALTGMTDTGQLKAWGDAIARISAFAADSVRSVGIVFELTGKAIGAVAAQVVAIAKLDFKSAFNIQGSFNKDFDAAIGSMTKMRDIVEKNIVARDLLVPAIARGSNAAKQNTADVVNNAIAKERATRAVKELTLAELRQQESTKRIIDLDREVRRVTESVATEQEIFNQKLEELNRLKPYLTVETYNRALQKAQDELKGTATVTRTATDEVSQMWIQAGRNIQSSLGNLVFDFFNGGLKDMVRNAGNAVLRITSEFAGLKMAQGLGLAGMFTAADASASTGAASSMLNMASLGTSAMNLFKVGGGISQGVSGLLGIGSTGTQAAAEAGATALWGASGASASIGSTIASFAGPAIAVAAVDQIVRMLAGDKMIGGAAGKILNYVPVIGPLINGLFGRGPMKQQGTLLEGQIGAGGFESGMLQTRFKAQGGLFRGDKIDYSRVDAVTGETFTDNGKLTGFTAELAEAGKQIFDSINEATKQTSTALRGVADTLGLTTNGIDDFSYSLKILTEKGEMIQGEQIAEEISKISEGLALSLMPSIDDFRRSNETAVQAISRLNTEFLSLTAAAQNLGASAGYAKELIKGMTFEQRTGLVDMAGGVESLSSMTSFFFTNFLSQSEQFELKTAQLSTALQDLGLSANLGADEFKALVQNVDTSNELRIALLQLAPAFLEVRNAAGSVTETIMKSSSELLGDAFASLRKSVDAERKKATDQYNTALAAVNSRIQSVTESISKLKSLSSALANTVDALRPLSREQAKFQILSAINTARAGGGLPDVADISRALNVLQSNNITGVKSSFELAREQAKTANLVADLGGLTNKQLSIEERSLMQLQDQRRALETGFSDEMLRLDSLLEQGQKEIDTLNGLNTTILSLAAAIEQFNLRSSQAGGGTIGGGAIGGNPSISDQQIIDYFAVPRTPQEIARDAIANGVTSQQIIATGRFTQAEADQFFRENDVPRFAGGGYHRGGLRIVGERGPEIERTGASNITSNSDLKKSIGNDEVLAELKKLNKLFDSVTQNGTALRTRTA